MSLFRYCSARIWFLAVTVAAMAPVWPATVFEITSPYHHIQVVDQQGVRTLSFDGTMETRMSLRNPLAGHFEYIEYFHVPLLLNREAKKALMIGLGGGSVQRSYQAYYPEVAIDTAELDSKVVDVAKRFFGVKETTGHQIHVSDGRVFLRRTTDLYDVIVLDAYSKNRYGSFIPYHLATKEFFDLASRKMNDDGVLAYNVMGTLSGWRANVLAAMYQTMKSVFPEVYLFPATDSMNVVLIGTKSSDAISLPVLQQRTLELTKERQLHLITLPQRIRSFRAAPPPSFLRAKVLTDDFAPVDGLLGSR